MPIECGILFKFIEFVRKHHLFGNYKYLYPVDLCQQLQDTIRPPWCMLEVAVTLLSYLCWNNWTHHTSVKHPSAPAVPPITFQITRLKFRTTCYSPTTSYYATHAFVWVGAIKISKLIFCGRAPLPRAYWQFPSWLQETYTNGWTKVHLHLGHLYLPYTLGTTNTGSPFSTV